MIDGHEYYRGKIMTVIMALVDYVPVLLFGICATILRRNQYEKMNKEIFALLGSGTMMILTAGLFKATWKLLYAAGICDFERLNQAFFPMQSMGFFMAGIAILITTFIPKKKSGTRLNAVAAPAVFAGTALFVSVMILGMLGMCTGLAVQAKREGKKGAAVLFLISFLLMMTMGYLSSRDFTQSYVNWIAQFVNIAGWSVFLAGVRKL